MGRERATALDRVLVVGAGVTGLTAALFLRQAGYEVEVHEAAAAAGGMLTPTLFRGIACDLGSHRVHGESLPLLKQAAPRLDWQSRPRRGALVLRQRHIEYPLRLSGFLRGLGPLLAARFGLGFVLQKARRRKFGSWENDRAALDPLADAQADLGFEHFVRERVGDSAYQAFYRPYAEKVWGLPARELSTVVAKKRISTAHPLTVLRDTVKTAIGTKQRPGATFEYPRLGMGALITALLDEAQQAGVKLHFNRRFTPADRDDPSFSRVIYSGNLADLLPQPALEHRGLYLIYLSFPVAPWTEVDTFYAPEGRYHFGRVSLPANFSPTLAQNGNPAETVLCVEVPEGRWGKGRDFASDPRPICEQLSAAGILPRGLRPVATQQIYLPHVYPLYRRGWLPAWAQAMRDLTADGRLFPIGRQGLFLHCNIDHCVQIAADLCAHLLSGGSATTWAKFSERYLDLRVRD